VEINPKICSGSPVIAGTRVRIVDIALEYEYLNRTPDEIINAHPHLKLEQIHDALSYYYGNRDALDKKIREDKQFIKKLAETQKGRWPTITPKRIKIYADESVSVAITEGLKRRGIKAFSARDLGKLGLTDEEQLKTAVQNQAVIFTHDVDFIRIATRKNHPGIIYVHQQKMAIGECIKRLKIISETKTPQEMRNQIIFL
jgi:uncharacterized protein (DUF433 family)/predicted nuclease of predicted toxin-antitoxin system